jgi:integrase
VSIHKQANGRWQVRYRDGDRQRGKTFRTKGLAAEFEREVLARLSMGDYLPPDRGQTTLAQWSEQWLIASHDLRPATVDAYTAALAHIVPALGHLPLARVTPEHIDAYMAAKTAEGLAPSTVHRHYRTLRRMFKVAVQRDKIRRSPMDGGRVKPPRIPKTEIQFLTAGQLEALAAAKTLAPWRTLVLVAGWGGLRWGELAGLRVQRVDVGGCRVQVVEQLDLKGQRVSEPKTSAGRRWVTLPESVVAELATHIGDKAPTDLAWTAPAGGPLVHRNFMRIWHPACEALGLAGVTPHDLRHTAVALAIAEGAHIKAIQQRMGHTSVTVTLDTYGHLLEGFDDRLATKLDDTRSAALTALRKLRVV